MRPPSASPVALEVRGLTVTHEGSGCHLVDSVSLAVGPGEILGLVGESGSGKTTLALALLGHARRGAAVHAERLLVGGQDMTDASEARWRRTRGAAIAYVPQDPATALNPAHRIGRQLAEAVELHVGPAPLVADGDRIVEAVTSVGLPDDPGFLRRYPHQLSGGQQQRVALALACCAHPRVLVLDEPTTGLDVTTQRQVLDLVRARCRDLGASAVFVSHDLAAVHGLADRVAVLYSGRLIEVGPTATVLTDARHPYTARLVAATPDLHVSHQPVGIPGRAASPFDPMRGCRFAPRCDQADATCRSQPPPLVEHVDGHASACWHADAVAVSRRPPRPRRPGPVAATVLAARAVSATHGAIRVLTDVDLDVAAGSCVAIVGESGSGKTTLARRLIGLHPDGSGELELLGAPLAPRVEDRTAEQRRRLQYVFQNPYASLNPRHTVRQLLVAPLRAFEGRGRADREPRLRAALQRVALPVAALDRLPGQLSGGERQRVAIARALLAEPQVLICDEVTSALDVSVQASVVSLLDQLRHEDGLSMLFITHDLPVVANLADQVLVLRSGRVVERGATEQVLTRPSDPYTRALLADAPTLATARSTVDPGPVAPGT